MFSVSIYESFTTTLRAIAWWRMVWDPSNYFYFWEHLNNIWISVFIVLFVYFFPIKRLKNHTFVAIVSLLAFIIQILVFVPGIGWDPEKYNWARWWIDVPWIPNIQPSEMFKLAYIVFISSRFVRKTSTLNTQKFYIMFIVLHFLIFLVFLFIPDLWTVLVLWLTWLVLARYAGAKFKYIWSLMGIWFLGIVVWWFILVKTQTTREDRFFYLAQRFSYFSTLFATEEEKRDSDRWIGRQNKQALIAIGGGGFFGQWYGKWLQKFWFIPEAQSDFIFAAFSEEIWFFGNMILLFFYWWLAVSFVYVIMGYKDRHLKLIGVGICILIIIQMFVNIWVNTRILMNTWLTLPFISHGWSAIIMNMIELTLLYKIALIAHASKKGLQAPVTRS